MNTSNYKSSHTTCVNRLCMLPDAHRISWSNMSMNTSNYKSSHTTCVNRLCMLPDVHRISWSNMSMNTSNYKSSHTTCVNRLCMLPADHRISWSNMSMNTSNYKSSHTTDTIARRMSNSWQTATLCWLRIRHWPLTARSEFTVAAGDDLAFAEPFVEWNLKLSDQCST